MLKSPCKDCSNRHIGCHSECKAYIEFSKANIEAKEARREYLRPYKEYNLMHSEFIQKQKRKHKKFL